MKKQVIVYNTASIISLNIIFWVCNYYPRHLLEFGSIGTAIIATVLNLIYFVAYFFILFIFFSKSKSFFSENIFTLYPPLKQQIDIKRIAILIGVQLVLEFLRINISVYLIEFSCIIIDLFTLFSWVIVYFVLTFKNENFLKNKKVLMIAIVFFLVVILISIILDIKMILEYQLAIKKYDIGSTYIEQTAKNLDFKHSIQNLILDSVIGGGFVFFHMIGKDFASNENKNGNNSRTVHKYKFSTDISTIIIRIFVLILAVLPIAGLKALIFRDSTIKNFDMSTGLSKGNIYTENKTISISRMSGYSVEKNVYDRTKIKIYDGDNKIAEVHSIDNMYSKEYSVNGLQVYVYGNKIICFKEDGVLKAIEFDDISKCKEKDVLTELLEQLISEGNVIAFEYGHEYLLKYNKAFIEPYIARYATADFNTQEEEFFDKTSYKKMYIVHIAKKQYNR